MVYNGKRSLIVFHLLVLIGRWVNDIQAVIVLAKLTAVKEHLWDFLHRNIRIRFVQSLIIGTAGNHQTLALLHTALDGIQIIGGQVPGSGKEVAILIAHRLFPEEIGTGLIGKAFM